MCTNNNCESLSELLCMIVNVQKQGQCPNVCAGGCDRPFLGTPNTCLYNTRPVSLYSCPANTLWTMPYGEETDTSSVFRAENVDGCCCTLRVLAPGEEAGTYTATDTFFTINLNCVGAVQCLPDTLVSGL